MGYYGTITPPGDRAQRAGEPGVVHGVHAVSAGDQPGSARGPAQLPDHGRRAHRLRSGQRVAARRGDGRRRGDDDGVVACRSPTATDSSSIATRIRRPSPCWRHGPSRSASSSSSATSTRSPAAVSAHCSACRHRAARSPTGRRPSRRCTDVGGLAVVATDLLACMLDRATGPARRRHRHRFRAAFRCVDGLRRPARGLHRRHRSRSPGPCPAAWWVSAPTPRAGRRCVSRCRPASSTSAARRRRPTSAPRRCCWPTSPGSTPTWHGPEGLRRIAERVHRLTSIAADALRSAGLELVNDTWFDTLQVRLRRERGARSRRRPRVSICGSSTTRRSVSASTRRRRPRPLPHCSTRSSRRRSSTRSRTPRPRDLPRRRTDEFLTQTVFSRYHTEHEMLRYLRRLADKDLALDRTMIPLGSCTMKLNATVEMEPLTWPGLADMHPFTPDDATVGIRAMIAQLEAMLVAITGYDAVSLQPNAGSQGEFAGLLAIHAYHRSRGDTGRDVCLIPSSAHGTNAASAVMAGLKVVVVRCDDARQHRPRRSRGEGGRSGRCAGRSDGDLSVDARCVRGAHQRVVRDRPPPRRAGVRRRREPQRDGRAGAARQVRCRRQPPQLAQDVLHPARRRRARRRARLRCAPTSPRSCRHIRWRRPAARSAPSSAAPFGSASILSISWVYIALMGASGLADASAMAVLNANYIATRLQPALPGAVHRRARPRRPRVHHRSAADHEGHRRHRRRRRQAIDRLRVPRADDELPGLRHADDRADRERVAVRARSVLRGDDRHQGRDRRGRLRIVGGGRRARCATLRTRPRTSSASGNGRTIASSARIPVAALRRRSTSRRSRGSTPRIGDRNLVCSCEPLEVLAALSN